MAAGVWGPQTVFGCSPGDVTDVYLWVGDTQGDAESYNTTDFWKCPGETFGWYVEWDADTPDNADFDGEIWVGSTCVDTFGADGDDRDKAGTATLPDSMSGGGREKSFYPSTSLRTWFLVFLYGEGDGILYETCGPLVLSFFVCVAEVLPGFFGEGEELFDDVGVFVGDVIFFGYVCFEVVEF